MISKQAQPFVIVGSLIVVVICIGTLIRGCKNPTAFTKEQLARLETNAGFSAQDVAEFLGDRTDVLLLYLEVPGSEGLTEVKETFQKVLTASGKNIIGEESLKPAGDGQFFNPIGWGYSIAELEEILSRHASPEVIVSLVGTPAYEPTEVEGLSGSCPPIVVGFTPSQKPDTAAWLDSGILEGAIIRNRLNGNANPQTPREKYDNLFQMYTADSESLPYIPPMP
jgi:hypothetical protein